MLERQRDVVGSAAPGQQGEILENERDRIEALRREIAEERDLAARRLDEPAHDRQQRALAAAGRADDGEHFAGRDRKRHVVEHPQGPEGVADVLDDQFHR